MNDNEPLLPENFTAPSQASLVDKESKKSRYFLIAGLLIFTALLLVAALILFRESPPPNYPLRAFLPADCIVMAEIHAPVKFSRQLRAQKFFTGIQQLSGWRLGEEFYAEQNMDLAAAVASIDRALAIAETAWIGLNNCVALAVGITADQQIAILIETDNRGYYLAKIASAFLPNADIDGLTSKILSPGKLSASLKDQPDFFITAAPRPRSFIIATSPDLPRRCQFAQPPKIQSEFYRGEHSYLEITGKITPDLPLENFALAAPVALTTGESFWRWNGKNLQSETRFLFPSPLAQPPVAENPLAFIPAETSGLTWSFSAADKIWTDEDLLAALLAVPLDGIDRFAPLLAGLNNYDSAARWLQNFTGNFLAQWLPANASFADWRAAEMIWTVDNPDSATKNFAAGVRAITAPPAAGSMSAFAAQMLSSSLFKTKTSARAVEIHSPFLSGFGKFGESRGFNYGSLTFTNSPHLPSVHPRPAKQRFITQGQWRWTPELRAQFNAVKKTRDHLALQKILAVIAPNFSPADFANFFAAAENVVDVLDSFQHLFITAELNSSPAVNGAENYLEILITMDGALRLPE